MPISCTPGTVVPGPERYVAATLLTPDEPHAADEPDRDEHRTDTTGGGFCMPVLTLWRRQSVPRGRPPEAQDPASSRNATSLSTPRLAGEAEHTLADHVALDLLGSTADAAAPLHQELLLPVAVGDRVAVVEHPAGTLEREHEVAVELLAP